MLAIKITLGGGDALVSRSYQAETGKVRPGAPQRQGYQCCLPILPSEKNPSGIVDGLRRSSVPALAVHPVGPRGFGQELGTDSLGQGRPSVWSALWDRPRASG